jgi:hypothetical protein
LAIGNAVERGGYVYAYDEKNRQIFSVPTGSGDKDGLMGYTASRVNVRRGSYIYSYDEKGHQVGSVPAR